MALCSVCLAIPFGNLPGPYSLPFISEAWAHPELPMKRAENPEDYSDNHDEPIGHSWHPNLESLANSASTCVLCDVVHQGSRVWLDRFKQAPNTLMPRWDWRWNDYRSASGLIPERNLSDPEGKRLWITRRDCGSPGFIVCIKEMRWRDFIHIITGVSFSVAARHPLAESIQLRPIKADSGSKQSLAVAATFLQDCRERHANCVTGEFPLPSRILDVGSPDGSIRLIESSGKVGIYACLSYCWGTVRNFTTTRETIQSRSSGFRVGDLPKTMSDAVKIVRHLGIRYLWIDSLCICQDDSEEWAYESSRMADTYHNAHLVVAANHAADTTVGCFHTRPSRPSCRVSLAGYADDVDIQLLTSTAAEIDSSIIDFKTEVLSNRGWALQERVLAKRVLHYNSHQMFYECSEGVMGEDGVNQAWRYCRLDHIDQTGTRENRPSLSHLWALLQRAYSQRVLTQANDAFPAMSGLAKVFANRSGAEYIAGCWSNNLLLDIAWIALHPRQTAPEERYIAPSWSWVHRGCKPFFWNKRDEIAVVMEWQTDPVSKANIFGALNSAWLKIRGPVVPLLRAKTEISGEPESWEEPQYIGIGLVRTLYTKPSSVSLPVEIDDENFFRSEAWKSLGLSVMLLFSCGVIRDKYGKELGPGPSCGLVVVNTNNASADEIRRVGVMKIPHDEAEKIKADKSNWTTKILV